MKLHLLTYGLVAVGLLANANPLRVEMGRPDDHTVSNVATIDATIYTSPPIWEPVGIPAVASTHQTCRARFRQKAIAISNAFRKAMGLPPIQVEGDYRILPIIGTPGAPTFIKVENGKQAGGQAPPERGGHHHRCRGGIKGFVMRLHRSLNALGPWEGKVVAFVLGCGIGVLLRMVWVLAVISYRSIKGGREPENTQTEYSLVLDQSDMEPAEVIFVAPPSYTNSDEKAALTEDAN